MTLLDQTLKTNVSILLSSFPGIRDGNADAIHDGRVATRRLRAVVPLASAGGPLDLIDGLLQLLRKAGRALGRARDTDVLLEQVDGLEQKLRSAPIAVSALLHRIRNRQLKERRRVIRKLDGLEFDSLTRLARDRRPSLRGSAQFGLLERTIAEQVNELRDAVTASSGVYFPNRAHRVRINAKKLRYQLELVAHPGVKRAVKRLQRVQSVLGSIQDRRALLDELSDIQDIPEGEREAVRALMTAESLELHRRYLDMRGDLLSALDDVARQAAKGAWRPRVAPRVLALGSLVGPTLVAMLAGRAIAQHRAVHDRSTSEPAERPRLTRSRVVAESVS